MFLLSRAEDLEAPVGVVDRAGESHRKCVLCPPVAGASVEREGRVLQRAEEKWRRG